MFAACNNEEIIVNEEQKMFENAELLGNGLSLNLNQEDDATTRVVDGAWANGDQAGLAWLVKSYSNGTVNTGNSTDPTLTGFLKVPAFNHMYVYNNGEFTSKSNIYKGWHFAYYPFQYQETPGQLVFDVNDIEMSDEYQNDKFNALKVTNADFLDGSKIDGNKGSIEPNFTNLKRMVNILRPIVNISEDITTNEVMQDIKIKSIEVNSGVAIFQNELNFVPANLPVAVYEKNVFNEDKTYNKINNSSIGASNSRTAFLQYASSTPAKKVTTTIAESVRDNYKLDGTKTLRVFLAPVKNDAALKESSLSIKVYVEGGYFTINYKDAEEINKAAIKKLYSLLSGKEDAENNPNKRNFQQVFFNKGTDAEPIWKSQPSQGLDIKLTKDNFTADFRISNVSEWNAAVRLAQELKEDQVKFNVVGDVKFDAENSMTTPKNKTVTVVGNKSLIFTAGTEYTWNNDVVNFKSVIIEKGATLNVVGAEGKGNEAEMVGESIVNNGIIKANGYAQVGAKTATATSFVNNNRVIVEYGAYVYPSIGSDPKTIAYEVANEDDIKNINILIKTHAKGYASVNTLIVKTELTLGAAISNSTDGDRYEGVKPGDKLEDLDNIAIELADNGAVVKGKGSNTVSVVTAVGANTYIKDIKIATNNLNTKMDADLTVKSDAKTNRVLNLPGGTITNEGTLTTEVNINCAKVDNESGTIMTGDYAITYDTEYIQGGTVYGNVNKKPVAPAADPTKAAKEAIALMQSLIDNYSDFFKGKSYADFVQNIKDGCANPPTSDSGQVAILAAINAWMDANNAGSGNLEAKDVTVDHIKAIEMVAGQTLVFPQS